MTDLDKHQYILSADDEPDDSYRVGHYVRRALGDVGIIEVLSVSNGANTARDAIDLMDLYGDRIAVFLSDVLAPGREDGAEMIRYALDVAKIPVIAVTSTPNELSDDLRERCLAVVSKKDLKALGDLVRHTVTNGNRVDDNGNSLVVGHTHGIGVSDAM